jgi:predicted nicotinamide N-methyase
MAVRWSGAASAARPILARVAPRGPLPESFLRGQTRPARPAIVPEITLHVAGDVVALWEAILAESAPEGADPPADPPFWAAAWPGGQALARYVLDHPDLVRSRSVLDLGSGSGLVAVAAALAGASSVLASEIDPYGIAAVRLNAQLNGANGITAVGDLLAGEPPDVSVVLAGDVCYDRLMTERVLPFLEAARQRGIDVLIGDPGRPYLPHDRLVSLSVVDVPDTEGTQMRSTTVWRMR